MRARISGFSLRPIVLGVSVALAGATVTASAQEAATQEGAEGRQLEIETIIVTARQREESVQDIPMAVTAFSRDAIARRGITELDDVARFTAGFAFEDFEGGNANPVIRGQTTLRTFAREQTVATFLDGVYMPRSWLVDLGLQNLERIEVVKGPQSARYGRNAFAGAINLIPVKASHEVAFNAAATVGSDERAEFLFGGTLPIIEDVLAVRLSYESSEFDGSWKNNHPNAAATLSLGTKGNIGGWDNEAYSVDILLTPTDQLTLNASYYGFERSEEIRATSRLNTGDGTGNCGPLQVGGNPSLYCGEYPVPGDVATMDPRGFGRQANVDIFRISADYQINEAMSVVYSFSNIQAFSAAASPAESDTINCGTILGPPAFPVLCNWQGGPTGDIDYDQHELRITFDNGGRWTGAAGAFYMDGVDDPFTASINLPPNSLTPINVSRQSTSFPDFSNFIFNSELTTTKAKSVFAEVGYAFSDVTRLSVEGRYTSEKITTTNQLTNPVILIGDETFKFFTPRITVEHDLTPDLMLYGAAARGAKAGGFNANAVSPSLRVFDPEFNDTYELGLKSTLLGGRAIVNTAVFYTNWDDMQINVLDPLGTAFTGTLTANLGDGSIWGAEVEGSVLLTENLSFDFAASYTDATYDSGTVDERFTRGNASFPPPCDGTVCPVDASIGGNTIERSPKTQLSAGVQWQSALTADIDYWVRADIGYQSSHFADSINAAIAPSRTITNASIGLEMDRFALRFWVRNLTDEKYVSNSLQIIQATSNNILGTFFGERRTTGVTLTYNY